MPEHPSSPEELAEYDQLEALRAKPAKERDWRKDPFGELPEQEKNQEFLRQALRELHAFSETMRYAPATYAKQIRSLAAGIETMLDGELAGASGQRFSPYPTSARDTFRRALEPLGFEPKSNSEPNAK